MEHFAGLAELDGVRLIILQKREFKVQSSTFKVEGEEFKVQGSKFKFEEGTVGGSDSSLTHRVGEGALGGGRPAIVDFGEELDAEHGAFMDTAAIMMNLDLVITSDTSVAHLAGALGVPVWVALPFVPIGGGCWSGAIARGIRRCDCFGRRRAGIGRECFGRLKRR